MVATIAPDPHTPGPPTEPVTEAVTEVAEPVDTVESIPDQRGEWLVDHREQLDRDGQLVEAEPVVRRICRSRLGYWDGDDAAQEALLSTWRATERPGFEDRGTLVPYAACAARSFSGRADRWRAGAGVETRIPRPALAGDQTEWGDAWFDPGPGPDEQVERAQDTAAAGERVAALLDELTPRQRQAVTECALRERDTDEVAAELGMSPSSVRSSQVRAMARMRELCGTRSTNPLAHNRTAADRYERHRQDWERARAEREQAEGRAIARRASRHRAAHVAAGRLPADTSPTGAAGPGETDAVARAAAAAERARASVAAGLVDDPAEEAARRAQLAAWHRDDYSDHDGHGDADGRPDDPGFERGAGAA